MIDFLKNLFSDKPGYGLLQMDLFSLWHILYLIIIIATPIVLLIVLKNKSDKAKNTALKIFAYSTVIIYILDFFIQPFYSGSGNMLPGKLPFHLCTIMSLFIPFVQFNKKFEPIKTPVAVLCIVSALMYLAYPSTAFGGELPWCYTVLQTFLYHGSVFVWGCLTVAFDKKRLSFKKIWKELVAILLVAVWATIGNLLYDKNFFFLTDSMFSIPASLMPVAVICAVFAVVALIYLIDYVCAKISKVIAAKKDAKKIAATNKE